MKKLILLALLFLSLASFSQKKKGKWYRENDECLSVEFGFYNSTYKEIPKWALINALCFTTGASQCTADILDHNPEYFYRVFPNCNKDFWANNWKAKYKNNDPEQGPKFLGSTTIFVGFTDGWHRMNSITHFQVGGIILLSCLTKDWYQIRNFQKASRIAANIACYSLGYNFTDRQIFQHR